jgi:hypothetical protein
MIKAPRGSKNAVPTLQGWVSGEKVVVRRPFTQAQIDEWNEANGVKSAPAPIKEPAPIIEADPVIEEAAPTAEPLIEADPEANDWSSMTKAELVEWGTEMGVDLDMTMTKAEMVSLLEG